MKTRRHHNTDGRRQIQRGNTRRQVECMAKRLGVRYGDGANQAEPTTRKQGRSE